MRGYAEEDPIEQAARTLARRAIKYAAHYLLDSYGEEAKTASVSLRQAAVAYAEATQPKKRKRTNAARNK